MMLCVCNCFLLYNYFLITIFLSKSALCSHFLPVCVKQKAMGATGMYPNMSHSTKRLAHIHWNKFYKLAICNCAHMFMVSQYRTAMGIENKNWRLNVSFWITVQIYPCGELKKIFEHIWTFIKKQTKKPKFSQQLFCLIIQKRFIYCLPFSYVHSIIFVNNISQWLTHTASLHKLWGFNFI